MERKSEIKKKDLQRAVDGELTKKETERLKAVLRTDPGVREELEGLKAVTEASQEVVKPVPPPAGFKGRVLDNLRKPQKP